MKEADLRRYSVRLKQSWAIIVIDTSIGYFSAVSDFGNYAYTWSHPGCEFRKFLSETHDDYIYGKLTHVHRVFDSTATQKAVDAWILESRRKKDLERDEARELYDGARDLEDERSFFDWINTSSMDGDEAYEAHGLYRTQAESQCWAFCTKVFPVFQEMLREELKKEEDAALEVRAEAR